MVSLPPLERGLRLLELVSSSSDGVTYKQAHQYLGVTTATVARLLKVLVQAGYLIQENACYKSGPALKRFSSGDNIGWLLAHNGDNIAGELADLMNESCVVAVYNDNYFEFSGVKIVEDSFSYGAKGYKMYPSRGHMLTMISHAMMLPQEAKKYFSQKDIFYDVASSYPSWEDYVKSIIYGMKNGHFLELGWRRPHLYRTAIPVFSENIELKGAFFCGFYNRETLEDNLDIFMNASFKTLSLIHDYQDIFDRGMKGLRKNLNLWQNELTEQTINIKEEI